MMMQMKSILLKIVCGNKWHMLYIIIFFNFTYGFNDKCAEKQCATGEDFPHIKWNGMMIPWVLFIYLFYKFS